MPSLSSSPCIRRHMVGLGDNTAGHAHRPDTQERRHRTHISGRHKLEMTPSAVSKLISRLEDRLGVRLLHRTTRRLAPTPEGKTYHLRAREISSPPLRTRKPKVSQGGDPHGRLRINSVISFALHHIAPALPDFIARYPRIEIEIAATDRVIDLLLRRPMSRSERGRSRRSRAPAAGILLLHVICSLRRGMNVSPHTLLAPSLYALALLDELAAAVRADAPRPTRETQRDLQRRQPRH